MEADPIFSSLIQTYESKTSVQQKQAIVKQTVEKVKLSDLASVQQRLHSQYEKIVKILKNHPQHTIQLVFSKLIVQDCVRLMKHPQTEEIQPTKQNVFLILLDEIGKNIDIIKDQHFIEWFSKIYTKYQSLQKVVIFMRQLVCNYAHKYKHEYLPQILADFINSSRLVVEAYLKLKAQAPKYDYEFMEYGDCIIKSTETWMKNIYIGFLRKIGVPNNNHLKLSVLNGVCDIIGAVLEVQREGNIQFSMCNQILQECFRYTRKATNLEEFNQMYLKKLGQYGFNIPNNKIIIPTRYPSNLITFPKQSYGFIVFKFVKQSTSIYSHQNILNYLIPVINQMAPFEYEIKTQIETLFVQVITSNQAQIRTCFEAGFPLSILYFNIWHYSNKKNQTIMFALDKLFEKIRLENPGKFVNNLRILSNLKIQNEENEINQFIGIKALQVAGLNPDLVVGLIKQTRFENTNEKGESVWRQVLNEIVKTKEVRQKVQRIFKQRGEKNKFEKQLQKTVQDKFNE